VDLTGKVAKAAQALVDRAVGEFGRLDVLVNNAGILHDSTLWKMTDEQFDAVITIHLRGTFTCTRAAAIRMREQGQGGRIICVGSPTGQVGNFGQTNYAAAKAGITGQTIGIGGDRLALWSHPSEVAVEFADGTGWSADAIAQVWPAKFAAYRQTVGQQFPEALKESAR
jgi:NAD(P)-dependent dehydrogenase (short-subunit alcohol dehydrogenase family)